MTLPCGFLASNCGVTVTPPNVRKKQRTPLRAIVGTFIQVERPQMFGLAAEFFINAGLGEFVDALHARLKILWRHADLLGKLFDGICLEGPAALITHFERLRQRLKRYAGQHDGVERQYGTLVNQIIDHGLVEDRVEHAARARHGIVDVDKHSAARLIEEALAFMIDPEPRLSQCAAALLEFVGARELVDRRNVRKIRCIAGKRRACRQRWRRPSEPS